MAPRSVARVATAVRTLEGEGFEVRRAFPTAQLRDFDPFLLLDELGPSEHGAGEAKGAPDHPHRGFETVTYVLAGEMEHRDSQGNHGRLGPGDVQWMTAGSGVIHSEMPSEAFQRSGGRMHGFQLWVNLPGRDKMTRPRYQDVPSSRIPRVASPDGLVRATVIAGEAMGAKAVVETRTPILYVHFSLAPGARVVQPVPSAYSAFAYIFRGSVSVGPSKARAADGQAALFSKDGDAVEIADPGDGAELLLIAGVPLREPVARYGPFVMNTEEEILQAVSDYKAGKFGAIPAQIG